MAWWWCVGTAASDRPSMAASWVPAATLTLCAP